jgi:prepilin-type N-terminal cleavage/methylation domain-containing protein
MLKLYLKKTSLCKPTARNQGFTLVELLVTVIIMGILAAVSLPSLLNQGNRTREATAQAVLGSINRAQQVHRFNTNTFATDLADLKIGEPIAEGYTFALIGTPTALLAQAEATPINPELSAFCGSATANIVGTTASTGVAIAKGPC